MSSHHRLMLSPKVIGGELQDRLIPVPYSKSSTDQAIRVVNAFRSNLDARNNPAYQTALLRKASAASPSGTGGFARPQLHSQPSQPQSSGSGFASPKEETAPSTASVAAAVPEPRAQSPQSPQQPQPPQQLQSPQQPAASPLKEGDATSNHSVETAV
ncbi:unnamed protein product [Ixodes persulcatus]